MRCGRRRRSDSAVAVGHNRGRLRLAEQTFAAGAIARFDVLRLENEVKRAEIAVNEAQSGLELALQALNSAWGGM